MDQSLKVEEENLQSFHYFKVLFQAVEAIAVEHWQTTLASTLQKLPLLQIEREREKNREGWGQKGNGK